MTGLIIYCRIGRDSQKYANIVRDPRVSLAIAKTIRSRCRSRACRSRRAWPR